MTGFLRDIFVTKYALKYKLYNVSESEHLRKICQMSVSILCALKFSRDFFSINGNSFFYGKH